MHQFITSMSGTFMGKKKVSDLLELEIQMAVRHRDVWVLGTEPGPSANAANALPTESSFQSQVLTTVNLRRLD